MEISMDIETVRFKLKEAVRREAKVSHRINKGVTREGQKTKELNGSVKLEAPLIGTDIHLHVASRLGSESGHMHRKGPAPHANGDTRVKLQDLQDFDASTE